MLIFVSYQPGKNATLSQVFDLYFKKYDEQF